MEPIFRQNFTVCERFTDRYLRLTPSNLLYFAQEVAGNHCCALSMDYDALHRRHMFWAVIRHRVQISRLPMLGEEITVETWPMPTTRVAYPRSTIGYDANGNELFRSISLWVLMDTENRSMILPGKSGVLVEGILRGTELTTPNSLLMKNLSNTALRTVMFSELDRNGHMNNTRYLDWIADLLPSTFHEHHTLREFTVCYLSEAMEQEELSLHWQLDDTGLFQVAAHRTKTDIHQKKQQIFTAQALFL